MRETRNPINLPPFFYGSFPLSLSLPLPLSRLSSPSPPFPPSYPAASNPPYGCTCVGYPSPLLPTQPFLILSHMVAYMSNYPSLLISLAKTKNSRLHSLSSFCDSLHTRAENSLAANLSSTPLVCATVVVPGQLSPIKCKVDPLLIQSVFDICLDHPESLWNLSPSKFSHPTFVSRELFARLSLI